MKSSEQSPNVIEFDASVYSIDTIKKAAYRYIDRFSANISTCKKSIYCALNFPENSTPESRATLVSEFQKEVLDQDLRQSIAAETASYRNAILALAFSSTKLTQSE